METPVLTYPDLTAPQWTVRWVAAAQFVLSIALLGRIIFPA